MKTSLGFGPDLHTSYRWDWSVLPKKKELNRDEHKTGLLEVIVTECYQMEGGDSREPFGFSNSLPSSRLRPTTVNTWVMTALQWILTPLFISVDIFALVVPYFFLFDLFLHNNYDCLVHKLDPIMTYMPVRLYKCHDVS